MFSQKEKEEILNTFNYIKDGIINENKSMDFFTKEEIQLASKGMYLKCGGNSLKHKWESIKDAIKKQIDPIVHEDSLTAYVNIATEKYGLTVGDITNMKFGDKLDIIFFDRNIGDYAHHVAKGSTIDPRKEGLTYATYIHGDSLSGILKFKETGIIHAPFNWEINIASLGSKMFWGPLGCHFDKSDETCCCGNKYYKQIQKLDPKILVGWRGPCIKASDAENLNNNVIHYDTWFDDYAPMRYQNYLEKNKKDVCFL